ncbi:PDF receptor-like [Ctenocephalides felis]|uniref:PDF receptor-like n=1 Tax=Ctenocephalides felis TaxID=7515 RepID=UPI000E6E17EB|nr:PDF receptor-like [Ctenocephalides felis]
MSYSEDSVLSILSHHLNDSFSLEDIMGKLNSSEELKCLLMQEEEKQMVNSKVGEDNVVQCNTYWDSVLCWTSTPAGTTAVKNCMKELNGVEYDTTRVLSSKYLWSKDDDKSRQPYP